jgi:hypothetical protein
VARSYTTRLLNCGAGVAHDQYVVPSGYRVVLRNVTCFAELQGGGAYVQVAGNQVWSWRSPGANGFTAFESRCVAYAGESIHAYTTGGNTFLSAAGYLFSDASGGAEVGQLPAVKPPPDYVQPLPAA